MPTYVYRRDDGTKFKTQQRITDEPLEECPDTGQPIERIITGQPGVILDGDTSTPSQDELPDVSCTGGCSL